tara:strand:+ start:685 stop:984 length:300 start_codon:yes stop_codon:yes gene_type:complete
MPKKGQYISKEEKKEMDRKARWGCVVCRKMDMSVITPAQIHHIRKGAGMGQRGNSTIPLCYHHHLSPKWGIHGMGTKAWTKLYGTEHELLAFYEEHKDE